MSKDLNQALANAMRQWALQQVGSPYVYGATGAPCTPALRKQQAAQYPEQADKISRHCPVLRGDQSLCPGCRYAGRNAYDCAQLTKRAMGVAGILLPSGASSQWKATIYSKKGTLPATLPALPCLLFRQGTDAARPMEHVGLHLGDGRVVDARSHQQGVTVSDISQYPWTHYALPAALDLGADMSLRPGDRGHAVKELQTLLMARGLPLKRYGADGIFGQETLAALHAFQARQGLPQSDRADAELLKLLREQPALSLEARVSALERQLADLLQGVPA